MKRIFHLKSILILFFISLILLPLHSVSQNALNDKTSLFDFIYQMEGTPEIKMETNIKKLVLNKMRESYQETSFQLLDSSGVAVLNLGGRIRARGNMRKQVSYLPPVKVDFKKPDLDSLGFLKLDKLKFVFPKDRSAKSQKKLLKEFFLYELYAQLDTTSIRVKLVDLSILHKGKKKYQFTCFIIEDEDEYARRNNAIIVEQGRLIASACDRESFQKMVLFQYMIANTDYSVIHKHNLEMVKFPERARVVAVPYDFDYSGFVGHDYAMPHNTYPIENVHQRYLFPAYRISELEYDQMVEYFLSREKDLIAFCKSVEYMNAKSIKENEKYLASFFKMLRKPKRLKNELVKR